MQCGTCKWARSPHIDDMKAKDAETVANSAEGTCHFNPPVAGGFPAVRLHGDFCRNHEMSAYFTLKKLEK